MQTGLPYVYRAPSSLYGDSSAATSHYSVLDQISTWPQSVTCPLRCRFPFLQNPFPPVLCRSAPSYPLSCNSVSPFHDLFLFVFLSPCHVSLRRGTERISENCLRPWYIRCFR